MTPILLLNSPVLTAEGTYRLTACSVEDARALVRERGFVSAVGHQGAAEIMSRELAIDCPMRRVRELQLPGHTAIVLRLSQRTEEGEVLSTARMQLVGYEFLRLERLD